MYTLLEIETGDKIPEFCSCRTAIFVSYFSKKPWPFLSAWYRITTHINAAALLNHGYDTLIVDYGSAFGRHALHELISIKRQRNYTLIAVKIIGEQNHYSDRMEEIRELAACDYSLGLIGKYDFLTKLVTHSSAIVHEHIIHYHCSRIPRQLLNYLKQIK